MSIFLTIVATVAVAAVGIPATGAYLRQRRARAALWATVTRKAARFDRLAPIHLQLVDRYVATEALRAQWEAYVTENLQPKLDFAEHEVTNLLREVVRLEGDNDQLIAQVAALRPTRRELAPVPVLVEARTFDRITRQHPEYVHALTSTTGLFEAIVAAETVGV